MKNLPTSKKFRFCPKSGKKFLSNKSGKTGANAVWCKHCEICGADSDWDVVVKERRWKKAVGIFFYEYGNIHKKEVARQVGLSNVIIGKAINKSAFTKKPWNDQGAIIKIRCTRTELKEKVTEFMPKRAVIFNLDRKEPIKIIEIMEKEKPKKETNGKKDKSKVKKKTKTAKKTGEKDDKKRYKEQKVILENDIYDPAIDDDI